MAKTETENKAATRLASMHLWLTSGVKFRQTELAEWAEKFIDNPAYELRWAQGVIQYAAELDVFKRVAQHIEVIGDPKCPIYRTPEEQFKVIADLVTKETVRGAQSPRQSTSAISNLMDQQSTAAWATILEQMDWMD